MSKPFIFIKTRHLTVCFESMYKFRVFISTDFDDFL